MKIMIVEDEPPAIEILRKYIKRLPNLELSYICSNPIEAIDLLNREPIDLLFLDINLPELSGVELFRSLTSAPKVIFTTAYSQYALEGFELQATDFLLKPFSFDRFLRGINKVKQELDNEKKLSTPKDFRKLFIKADRKLYQIDLSELLILEAYGDYVKVITTEKQILPKETLQKLSSQLPEEGFMRIHRSYVINLAKIEYIEGNLVHINGKNYPVGKAYKEDLLNRVYGKS